MLDKRGQIADTLNWTVVTLVVFVIVAIMVSISIVSTSNQKNIQIKRYSDVFAEESFYAFLKTDISGSNVYDRISSNGDFDGVTGPLAQDIFLKYYEDEYYEVWLGVYPMNVAGLVKNYFLRNPPDGLVNSKRIWNFIPSTRVIGPVDMVFLSVNMNGKNFEMRLEETKNG